MNIKLLNEIPDVTLFDKNKININDLNFDNLDTNRNIVRNVISASNSEYLNTEDAEDDKFKYSDTSSLSFGNQSSIYFNEIVSCPLTKRNVE